MKRKKNIIKGKEIKCPCEDHYFCEVYQRLYPAPEYCINAEKLKEEGY
jgi:hypothetical protein